MENEVVQDAEIATGAAVLGTVEAVVAPVEAVVADVEKAGLDIHALCDEAKAALQAIYERVKDHPDAKGLRSTLNFLIGRLEAQKQQ